MIRIPVIRIPVIRIPVIRISVIRITVIRMPVIVCCMGPGVHQFITLTNSIKTLSIIPITAVVSTALVSCTHNMVHHSGGNVYKLHDNTSLQK